MKRIGWVLFDNLKKLGWGFISGCFNSSERKNNSNILQIETFDEHFEICSMVGTISKDGTHLHTTLSRNDGSTVGGHVISDMIVFT